MNYRLIVITILLGSFFHTSALSKNNNDRLKNHSIYGEIFGATHGFSISYDFTFRNTFGTRFGVGTLWAGDNFVGEGYKNCEKVDFRGEESYASNSELVSASNCSPALFSTINYLPKIHNGDFVDVNLELATGSGIYLIHGNVKSYLIFNIGLKTNIEGLIIRAGYTPLYNFERVLHGAGFSLGMTFKNAKRVIEKFNL